MGSDQHPERAQDQLDDAAIAEVLGDRYQIVRTIGAGATGIVLLARDTRLHRMVAIKVLRPELAADPDRRAEFLREARLVARLQHPGIVPVYDIIEGSSAVAVVMPFGGESLASHLAKRGGRLPAGEACALLLDIVGTLEFVHRSGILHRDLKPANVLLEPSHDRLRARLTDFGIAIVPLRDYGMSGQPVAAGTPGFMSPEQMLSVSDTDRRSDIYAVGALAYVMVAGSLPFADAGRTPRGTSRTRTVTPLRVTAPWVPRPLARIIERCLADDPTDRWPNAAALYAALDAYGRTLQAPATSSPTAHPPYEASSVFNASFVTRSIFATLPGLLRDAGRSLRRAPAFSALVIGTLALGIGANGTMLAVLDELVLRPPRHVQHPEQLFVPALTIRLPGNEITNRVQSYPVFSALRADTSAFAGVAMFSTLEMSLGTGEIARPVSAMTVSGDYFRVLGTLPRRGRLLQPDDDAEPSGAAVAVISEGFWRTRFGARAEAVGETVLLDNARYEIVGIAPRGFAGMRDDAADVWLPVSATRAAAHAPPTWRTNGALWLGIVVRLREGITPAAGAAMASRDVRAASAPQSAAAQTATVAFAPILPRLDGSLENESRVALLLAAVSIFVLLTACANVTNLTLARNVRRASDLTIRQVLGATQARLASLLLTEALVLVAVGGVIALGFMYIGGPLLLRFLQLNPDAQLVLDLRTIGIAFAVSTLAGVAAGLGPAFSVPRDQGAALRTGARSLSRGGRAARRALLGVQCASCTMLLIGCGLFTRSLAKIDALDLGFEASGVWTGRLGLSQIAYDSTKTAALMRDIRQRAALVPGISDAAVASNTPLSNAGWVQRVRLPGRDSLPRFQDGGPYYMSVSHEFFAVVRARVVRGRAFTADDRAGTAPVVIINERVARTWFPGADPLGQCMYVGSRAATCSTIVGVVQDMRRQRLVEEYASSMLYLPIDQYPADYAHSLVLVRAADGVDPTAALREVMQTAAPGLPYASVAALEASVTERTTSWRLGRALFGAFGALATIIAVIGIYGVFSFAVAQQKREIGIRIALGALSSRVLATVLGEGVGIALAGALAGIAAAVAAAPLVAPLLFEVDARDPVVLAASGAGVLVISALACLIPARRATKVDPMAAIRAE